MENRALDVSRLNRIEVAEMDIPTIANKVTSNVIYRKIADCVTFDDQTDSCRENANINSNSAMGVLNKAGAESLKEYYLDRMIPKQFSDAHREGLIHIHDLDFYGFTATCLQIDLEKLFENGFNTGHGTIRTPQSIRNYFSLVAIVIQSNQNDMHGGQSIPKLEYDCAPGVAKSFAKYLAEAVIDAGRLRFTAKATSREFRDAAMKRVYKMYGTLLGKGAWRELSSLCEEMFGVAPDEYCFSVAFEKTVEETLQGAEALIHNLCTMHSRAGSQVPFSSINYGTGTTQEQRLIINCVLQALDNGLGKGETQIFPIHIFKVKKGVNYNPGDPNYDLFQKAIKVTSRRMFPNFEFLDAPFNLQYYREGDPDSEVATMGCVPAESGVAYIINDTWHMTGIGKLYERVAELEGVSSGTSGRTEYLDVPDGLVRILDSHIGEATYVSVKRIIRNRNTNNWRLVRFSGGRALEATGDHPLPIAGKGRVLIDNLEVGDTALAVEVPLVFEDKFEPVEVLSVENVPGRNGEYSYDVETESDYFDVDGIASHNCRTRVIGNVNGPSTTSGRGNLSFTSINLPRLAIEANHDMDVFWESLDSTLSLCLRQLLQRFDLQCRRHTYNFPFLFGNKMYMNSEEIGDKDSLFEALKNGTLSIGFVGLAECLVALIGKHHGESEEAQRLGLRIVGRINDFCGEATRRLHLNVTCLATPAESTASTFLRKDRRDFGVIKGVTDRDYYTNSSHVPVYFEISAKDKIAIEAPYHALTPAGHITYVEFPGDPKQNLEAVEEIVRMMYDAGVGYGAINHPIDTCRVCGTTGVIGDKCPKCGNSDEKKIQRLRRITGYLVGDRNTRFNQGKLAEEHDRVKHRI